MMATTLRLMALLAMITITMAALPSSTNSPCLSTEFSLAMRVGIGNESIPLTAVGNDTEGTLFLVAQAPNGGAGTPVALKGAPGSATLDVKINDSYAKCENIDPGTYGISVPDLGELYGTAVPVLATKGFEWPHFYYGENEIEPQRTAASQLWYACNMTIQGETRLALSWGVYNSNGSSPWGCSPSGVIQVFDIPCVDA